MSKTNSGLVAYAKAQVGKPYWYGCYGQTASASLYASKKKAYPSQYTASDFTSQYGQRVHDCGGLVKGYLWSDSATATPKYAAAQDKSAAGLYSAATMKGKIGTFDKVSGRLVFKGDTAAKIHHVGVYDGGYVYEAKGHAYGVTKTAYKASEWDFWAQCPYCADDTSATVSTGSTVSSSGSKVDAAQSKDSSLSGTYTVTASALNLRAGAGTGKAILTAIPKGGKVRNYGYYTAVSGVKWLYVQYTAGSKTYTGFCSSKYLKKA
uniref:SH3 domain protein n=1 Tax=uncultured bacterium scaffold00056 TaxID=1132475 RepID=I6ZXL4_9BACT|nr:SH3 domain protein [uncultured bacterium scaffold00056]